MSREMALLVDAFGYDWTDLQWFTINAMKSAFIPFDDRLDVINDLIKPGYAQLLDEPLQLTPASTHSSATGAAKVRLAVKLAVAAAPTVTVAVA